MKKGIEINESKVKWRTVRIYKKEEGFDFIDEKKKGNKR